MSHFSFAPAPVTDNGSVVSEDDYRSAFRRYAAGVVVVTADAGAGRPAGFTATSLASVSLSPPLVSFSLSTSASSWPTIAEADHIVVNFLGAEHHDTARRFATSGIDRFAAPTEWSRLDSGEPVLDDVPGYLRGRITHRIEVGDHHIVVAHVLAVTTRRQYSPLVYHAGTYGTTVTGGN